MGKWAQYKRRGGARTQSTTALGPPPAPQMLLIDSEVIQRHTGLADPTGQCALYSSYDGIAWELLPPVQDWSPDTDWGGAAGYEGQFLRCTEFGNGVIYQGESIPSNVLDLT